MARVGAVRQTQNPRKGRKAMNPCDQRGSEGDRGEAGKLRVAAHALGTGDTDRNLLDARARWPAPTSRWRGRRHGGWPATTTSSKSAWRSTTTAQAQKVFPPGTVCTAAPIQPNDQYDVLKEAAETGIGHGEDAGPQGTSFLLRILPYIEGDTVSRNWNWNAGDQQHHRTDIAPYAPKCNFDTGDHGHRGFYCPTAAQQFSGER